LSRLQIVAMPAHPREQSSILGTHRIQISPAAQEMMVDQPNDVEPIRHDESVGKVFAHDRAIHRRQVHTDHTNQTLSF